MSLFGVVVRAVSSAASRFPRSSVTLLELPALPQPILVSGPVARDALNKAFDEVLSGAMAVDVSIGVRFVETGAIVVEISGAEPEAGREVWLSVVELDATAVRGRSRPVSNAE